MYSGVELSGGGGWERGAPCARRRGPHRRACEGLNPLLIGAQCEPLGAEYDPEDEISIPF